MIKSDLRQKIAKIIDADHSNSFESRIYDWCMCAVIILSLLPLMILNERNPFLKIISWVTVIIFLIDFVARCYVSPIDSYKTRRPWWRRYPFTFMGVVDLLSILPIFGLITNKFALFRLFRLGRIVSIIKLSRYSDMDDMLLSALKKNAGVLKSIMLFIFLYIYMSALLMYNVEPHINPMTGEETFSNFFDAVYWSVVTLTTVGYGDIYPVTLLGKFISILSMVFGVGIIATISSVVTAGIIKEINRHKRTSNED